MKKLVGLLIIVLSVIALSGQGKLPIEIEFKGSQPEISHQPFPPQTGDHSNIPTVQTGAQSIHGQRIKQAWTGKVIAIADGDTATIIDGYNQQHKIRLSAIDAPERGQPFGEQAKQALSSMIYQQVVDVFVVDSDQYGREIAFLRLGTDDINGTMVYSGWAWEYDNYSKSDVLGNYEYQARQSRLGLWSGAGPYDQVPPWEWRASKR